VLVGGWIVESGSQEALLAANGVYARLYRLQAERESWSRGLTCLNAWPAHRPDTGLISRGDDQWPYSAILPGRPPPLQRRAPVTLSRSAVRLGDRRRVRTAVARAQGPAGMGACPAERAEFLAPVDQLCAPGRHHRPVIKETGKPRNEAVSMEVLAPHADLPRARAAGY
jgi:hypothetical protein